MSLAMQLHEALVASPDVHITNLYTGDCKGCGECCSRFLPMSAHDKRRVLDYVGEKHVAQNPECDVLDLTCPYLKGGMCAIYDARPDMCRAYRCDLHANGEVEAINAMLLHHPYEVCDMRDIGAWRV